MKRVIYKNKVGDQIRVNYPVNFAVSPYLYAIGDDENLNDLADAIETAGDEAFRTFCEGRDRKEATIMTAEVVAGFLSFYGFKVVR